MYWSKQQKNTSTAHGNLDNSEEYHSVPQTISWQVYPTHTRSSPLQVSDFWKWIIVIKYFFKYIINIKQNFTLFDFIMVVSVHTQNLKLCEFVHKSIPT